MFLNAAKPELGNLEHAAKVEVNVDNASRLGEPQHT